MVGIAALLISAYVAFGNPTFQSAKAKDSKRISDIQQLKNALDVYYNDHKCYPATIPTDTWTENGVVYMIKVPKDPDLGGSDLGYVYQVNTTDPCPQWNVLYSRYTAREFTEDDCSLTQMPACNYTENWACSVSGQVDCDYVANNPAITSSCTPKLYIRDSQGVCNVAPEGEVIYCNADCSE